MSKNNVAVWQGLSPQAEVAARAFVQQLLARELSEPAALTSSHIGRVNQPPVRAGDSAQPVTNNDMVRQAMQRWRN